MKKRVRSIWLAWGLAFLLPVLAPGQEAPRIEVKVDLNYFQVNNESPYLTTKVRTRTESGWMPVKWVIVNLFLNEETKLGMMGNVTTDEEGRGKYILPDKFRAAWDSLDQFTFIGRILSDEKVVDTRKIITIRKTRLVIDAETVDSVRTMRITFSEKQGAEWRAVPEVEWKPFIHRTFGKLPMTEDYLSTDDAGIAEIEFLKSIPGDKMGNITVGAILEDHDDYGTISGTKSVAWGLPLVTNTNFFEKRTLWSSRDRTPIWLLVGPNLMILFVWGAIGYLVYLLVVLKRIYRKSLAK
ncbi:MAG: hypothetical protein SH819_03650 [Cytophagales bacterium]|nr:hypothetical protein [Cytophagales bacterium]